MLLRSDGVPLYNFGAVVDDITMGITLVARGRDHMVNTPPQILLYQALGAQVPDFAHLPMMLAPNGEKLSKRHGAVSVGEYREPGVLAAARCSTTSRASAGRTAIRKCSRSSELVDAFDWEHCNKSDGKFDAKKFLAIDHEHLKATRLTPDDEYAMRLAPFVAKRGLSAVSSEALKKTVPLVRDRATTFVDAADRLDFVFRDPPAVDEAAAKKFLGADSAPVLAELAAVVSTIEPWTVAAIEARVHGWLAEKKLQIKDVAQPARVALTGRTASPGLYEVIEALGKERAVRRLTPRAS